MGLESEVCNQTVERSRSSASPGSVCDRLIQQLRSRSFVRWWIAGLAFTAGFLAVLYVLHGLLHLRLIVATSVGGEAVLALRFLINDRWVFGHRRPTWTRFWQFHVASAGGGIIWWIITNLLPPFGIPYLLASIIGTAGSVFFSMATNFLWIWRKQHSKRAVFQAAMLESTAPCTPTAGIKSPTSG